MLSLVEQERSSITLATRLLYVELGQSVFNFGEWQFMFLHIIHIILSMGRTSNFDKYFSDI